MQCQFLLLNSLYLVCYLIDALFCFIIGLLHIMPIVIMEHIYTVKLSMDNAARFWDIRKQCFMHHFILTCLSVSPEKLHQNSPVNLEGLSFHIPASNIHEVSPDLVESKAVVLAICHVFWPLDLLPLFCRKTLHLHGYHSLRASLTLSIISQGIFSERKEVHLSCLHHWPNVKDWKSNNMPPDPSPGMSLLHFLEVTAFSSPETMASFGTNTYTTAASETHNPEVYLYSVHSGYSI